MKPKARKTTTPTMARFPKADQEVLKAVHDKLWTLWDDFGYMILESQWMKNPKVSEIYYAPVMLRGDSGKKVGVVQVSWNRSLRFAVIRVLGTESDRELSCPDILDPTSQLKAREIHPGR